MTKGYLISEGLRDKIHATIERVAGTPYGGGVTNVTPRLENIQAAQQKLFRICTFTGAWSIGSAKEVTFRGVTTTPNTVSAVNLFFPITNTSTTTTTNCAIAKDGTAWYLIDVPFATATAVIVTSTQSTSVVTDVALSATLNTSSCTISIGKTLTTSTVAVINGTATATFLRVE